MAVQIGFKKSYNDNNDLSIYINNFDDEYHLSDSAIEIKNLYPGVMEIKRIYKKRNEFIKAMTLYKDYMKYLYASFGNHKLYYKLAIKNPLLWGIYIPPKPKFKNTKTPIIEVSLNMNCYEKLINNQDVNNEIPIYLVKKKTYNSIIDINKNDRNLGKYNGKGEYSNKYGSLEAENISRSSIDYLTDYYSLRNKKKEKSNIDTPKDVTQIYNTLLMGEPKTKNPFSYMYMANEPDIINEEIYYKNGKPVSSSELIMLKLYQNLQNMGYKSNILYRNQFKNEKMSKFNKSLLNTLDEFDPDSKYSKKKRKKEKKRRKKMKSFLENQGLKDLLDYDDMEDYETEMLDMTSNSIYHF